ncbi:hypothetical protein [Vibrio owensii]|uniref:hypothetical protein n=1 Tax=Vibrio harveyi group TaxID=717610 RepID=UPI003CC50B85
MAKLKISEAQELCLNTLKTNPAHKFSGFSARTLQSLKNKGLIEKLQCSALFDPVRGYSRSIYTAKITDKGKEALRNGN